MEKQLLYLLDYDLAITEEEVEHRSFSIFFFFPSLLLQPFDRSASALLHRLDLQLLTSSPCSSSLFATCTDFAPFLVSPPSQPTAPLPLLHVAQSKPLLPTTRSTPEHLSLSAIKLSHRRSSVRDLHIVVAAPGFDRSDSTSSLDSNSSSSSYGSMPATPTNSEGDSRSPFTTLGSLAKGAAGSGSSSSLAAESYSSSSSSKGNSNLRLPSPGRRRHTPSLDTIADAAQSPPRRSNSSISPLPTAVLSISNASNFNHQPRTPTRRTVPSDSQKTSPTSMAAGGSFLGRLLGGKRVVGRRVCVVGTGREEEGEVVVL